MDTDSKTLYGCGVSTAHYTPAADFLLTFSLERGKVMGSWPVSFRVAGSA
jgi:hypothetical protein